MSDIQQFLERFFQGLVDKDIQRIDDSYLHAERLFVFLEGPRSKTIGWTDVRSGWEKYLASRISVVELRLGDDAQIHDGGDTGWVAASLRAVIAIDGAPPKTLDFRGTWLLEKNDGRWRIVHEHVSLPHPDPYGVGDWAKSS